MFAIYLQDSIAYRASGFIWTLTDVATGITMPLVWVRASTASGQIGGFTQSSIVLYYLCMLFLNNFITSHIMWDLATEIREGQFTTVLIRPISYYQYTFMRNISWRLVRPVIFLPIFALLLLAYHSYLGNARLFFGWQMFASVLLGHLVSFTFVMMMTMLAFFTTEVYSIFELYYVPMMFLSGQLFPVSVMPGWAQTMAHSLPFYFTTGAPTEILVGRLHGQAVNQVLTMQLAWIIGAYLLSRVLWFKGLKFYTAVGM